MLDKETRDCDSVEHSDHDAGTFSAEICEENGSVNEVDKMCSDNHPTSSDAVGEEDEDEDEDAGLPIDRGWAWVVLAGCFLNVTLMIGYSRGLAILFIEYLKMFEASTAKTTLLMGVNAGFYSVSAPIVMHVVVGIAGTRKTIFIGAFITCVGMVTAVFAPSIDFLIGTHSILIGVGNAMVYGPSVANVGRYFNKRRGFATSVAMSAVSFAGSVFPPMLRAMLDEYGLKGTYLIITALTLNMFVGGAVNRNIDSFRKSPVKKTVKDKSTSEVVKTKECVSLLDVEKDKLIFTANSLKKHSPDKDSVNSKDGISPALKRKLDTNGSHVHSKPESPKQTHAHLHEHESEYSFTCPSQSVVTKRSPLIHRSKQNSSDCHSVESGSPFNVRRKLKTEAGALSGSNRKLYLFASHSEFGSMSVMDITAKEIVTTEEDKDQRLSRFPSCCRKVLLALDLSLFKKPMFLMIISYSFFSINIALVPVYLPALAKEKGISQHDAALFLTVLGALDFFCRLLCGFVVDRGYLRINTFMAIGLILTGTITHFSSFFNTYALLLGYCVVMGIFSCTYFGLIPVGIVEFMGLEYLGKTIGFVSLFHGTGVAISHPIVGGIRDATGSYTGAFNFIGTCAYIGAVILLFEPLIRKYANKNANNNPNVTVKQY